MPVRPPNIPGVSGGVSIGGVAALINARNQGGGIGDAFNTLLPQMFNYFFNEKLQSKRQGFQAEESRKSFERGVKRDFAFNLFTGNVVRAPSDDALEEMEKALQRSGMQAGMADALTQTVDLPSFISGVVPEGEEPMRVIPRSTLEAYQAQVQKERKITIRRPDAAADSTNPDDILYESSAEDFLAAVNGGFINQLVRGDPELTEQIMGQIETQGKILGLPTIYETAREQLEGDEFHTMGEQQALAQTLQDQLKLGQVMASLQSTRSEDNLAIGAGMRYIMEREHVDDTGIAYPLDADETIVLAGLAAGILPLDPRFAKIRAFSPGLMAMSDAELVEFTDRTFRTKGMFLRPKSEIPRTVPAKTAEFLNKAASNPGIGENLDVANSFIRYTEGFTVKEGARLQRLISEVSGVQNLDMSLDAVGTGNGIGQAIVSSDEFRIAAWLIGNKMIRSYTQYRAATNRRPDRLPRIDSMNYNEPAVHALMQQIIGPAYGYTPYSAISISSGAASQAEVMAMADRFETLGLAQDSADFDAYQAAMQATADSLSSAVDLMSQAGRYRISTGAPNETEAVVADIISTADSSAKVWMQNINRAADSIRAALEDETIKAAERTRMETTLEQYMLLRNALEAGGDSTAVRMRGIIFDEVVPRFQQ